MSTVSANIRKNRLYITLQEVLSTKELEKLYTDIRFCVADLQPGFSVVNNLTQVRIGHLSAIGTYRKIMQFLMEKKVGQVVRVIGNAKIIYLQMLKLSDKIQHYQPIYVETIEEAEALLDEKIKKTSIA